MHEATVLAPGASVVGSIDELVQALGAKLEPRQVSIAGTVVLLPFPQLGPLCRKAWQARAADGFTPRFETAQQCANRLGGAMPGAGDITFDLASDHLTAQSLLESAGIESEPALVARLVERAHLLAQPAAAAGPEERFAWAASCRMALAFDPAGTPSALDTALSRIAVEWCAASRYATDILFGSSSSSPWECLFTLEGFHADPLLSSLRTRWADRSVSLLWTAQPKARRVSVAGARDAEDEAEFSTGLILQQLALGRSPLALIANDRFLTRRVNASLEERGVRLHDETGWTLSTTRAAAQVMVALRACAWNADSDQLLEWLKSAPELGLAPTSELERVLRRQGASNWREFVARSPIVAAGLTPWLAQVEELRAGMREPRPLTGWLDATRCLLQATGLWESLRADAAGAQVIAAMRLAPEDANAMGEHHAARQRWTLPSFTAWAGSVLESHRFIAPQPDEPEVVILPLSQLLGRAFAAVVMPGCDDVHLSASPNVEGPWSAAQRVALGLPARADLELAQQRSWDNLLNGYACQLLWRGTGRDGEQVQPSPLLRALQLAGSAQETLDPRVTQRLAFLPLTRPSPRADRLPIHSISASAYEDLRRCPYRFFALHQLDLRESEELDEELDKRDFGLWLHEVLRRFHEGAPELASNAELQDHLEQCAQSTSLARHIDPAQFLPFQALWPNLKKAYIEWLSSGQTEATSFEAAEKWLERELGAFKLVGKVDRIDRLSDGAPLLIDYKTESVEKTRRRIADPGEDTQLAFYAALLGEADPKACYLSIGERGDVREFAQTQLLWARDALLDGLRGDIEKIQSGAGLPALGEGVSCDHCAARGLCRKDFWDRA